MAQMLLTQRTACAVCFKNETNGKKSETVPDQAVSALELLRRYATGQPLGFKQIEPVYDDPKQETIPEFYKMSKLDRLHALQENHSRVKDLQEDYKYEQAEAKKAEALKQQAEAKKAEALKQQESQAQPEAPPTSAKPAPNAKE